MELKELFKQHSNIIVLSSFAVADITLENSNLLSCGASDDVPLPSKNVVKMDVDPKEGQMTSFMNLESSQFDRTDKAAIAEASLSSQSVSGQLPVSEAEAGVYYNTVENLDYVLYFCSKTYFEFDICWLIERNSFKHTLSYLLL